MRSRSVFIFIYVFIANEVVVKETRALFQITKRDCLIYERQCNRINVDFGVECLKIQKRA